MKFYTDPGFFFNIWCNELIKDNETRKMEKKKRKVWFFLSIFNDL